MDELADKLGIDRLEFRHRNALRAGDTTATGQMLAHSRRPRAVPRSAAAALAQGAGRGRGLQRQRAARSRRGVGVGCMWYGIGNTSMSNPSRMRIGLSPDGTLTLYSGAVDIGQGSNTIMTQIAADALGLPVGAVRAGHGRHRSHRRCRQDLGLAPDLRLGQGGRTRRPRPAPADPAPGQCRARRRAVARRRQAHGARRRRGARASTSPTAGRADGRGHLRSADHAARRRRPGHALCDLCLRRADRRWSRSISSWAR